MGQIGAKLVVVGKDPKRPKDIAGCACNCGCNKVPVDKRCEMCNYRVHI